MTHQTRGVQISLILHSMLLLFMWGMHESFFQSPNTIRLLDFTLMQGSTLLEPNINKEKAARKIFEEKSSHNEEVISFASASVLIPDDVPASDQTREREVGKTSKESSKIVDFGSATGPHYQNQIMPVYPFLARKMGKEGKVLLRLIIDERGKLLSVDVLHDPGFGFAEAAVKAVKQSRYLPAIQGGNPVLAEALLPITFVLKDF
ncbi:MAG: energy transducer TonB [Nitrospirota bacterium]